MPNGGKKLTSSTGKKQVPLASGNTKPNLTAVQKEKKITFSFAYFKQYPFFQLADQNPNWFASLFDRLKDLSEKNPDIISDYTARKTYRIHPVNWAQPHIPIRRCDLDSVPQPYRDNDTEYPFWQFTLSRSLGRVAGFFNEESSVFYIVLLDPKHNLQPAKDHGYKVDDTSPLPSPYEIILSLAKKCEHAKSCALFSDKITFDDTFRTVFFDTTDSSIIDTLKQKGISFHDAFQEFILQLIEKTE